MTAHTPTQRCSVCLRPCFPAYVPAHDLWRKAVGAVPLSGDGAAPMAVDGQADGRAPPRKLYVGTAALGHRRDDMEARLRLGKHKKFSLIIPGYVATYAILIQHDV